jgi:chemosensory pili system protein ChpA (sensor histidine kinase/response regulator)
MTTNLRSIQATALTLFTEEFQQNLPQILAALDTLEGDRSNRGAAKEAHRLIHALKGGASMVGLAAFGYLLNVAEELIEESMVGSRTLTDEGLEVLRASMPRFAAYMEAALTGQPVEQIANTLARSLRLGGGTADVAALKDLIDLEAREIAQLPTERVEGDAPDAEPIEVVATWTQVVEPEPEPEQQVEPEPLPEEPIVEVVANDDEVPVASEIDAPVVVDEETSDAFELTPGSVAIEPEAAEPEPVEIAEAAPTTPAAQPTLEFDVVMKDDVPPELAEVFGEEAKEHLETIARLTSRLSVEPQDRESVQELRRAVHTLKGAAGVVGYKGASKLAHRMEDLLDRLYEESAAVTPREARVLASSSDALNDLIVGTADADALRSLVIRLFAEFDALMGAAPAAAPAEAIVEIATTSAPQIEAAETAAVDVAPQAPASESAPFVERRKRGADRRGGQALRVPLQRLNELVRVVSELVINRSSFEQHHSALIEQVDELKLSTARLRRVTHKLESDYEVRAMSGGNISSGAKSASSGGGHGFDELEFDRYTEFHLLTRELTETASDIATIGARVAATIGDFDSDLTRLGRLTREVQDKTMEFRMVPLGTLETQLERAVRATGESCGKQVEFAMEGAHVALDKSLLEQMADPLLHLLRNAVDHGIESGQQRLTAGKPERGQITVRAFHEGTDVLIEVQDDGKGLDIEKIRRIAIERGLVTEAAAESLSGDAVQAFIFEPGFSTADHISEVSGRGVGMDVVKSKVARLSGRVYVTSQPGEGTTISVRVPMTLAISRVLLVRAAGQTFGLPLGAVVQIVRPHPTALSVVGSERVFTLDGKTYPLRDLSDALGLARPTTPPTIQPVLIANLSRRRIALAVDEIVNSRDAVVKKLGTHLKHVPGIWGATLLGDGTVVLILNPADLAGAVDEPVVVRQPVRRSAEHAPYNVLIVDDSLSMRHVLSLAVKKAGWNPVPARDGLEALEIIDGGVTPPDLVLLDIEMPRMDGFEFLSTVRSQKARADLPIVMLTSRGGDKHRDKARALGVTDYMVKPFQEEALVANIDRLVKESRAMGRRAAS